MKSTGAQSLKKLQRLDFKIGYQDSNPSNDHQGDMPYYKYPHAWLGRGTVNAHELSQPVSTLAWRSWPTLLSWFMWMWFVLIWKPTLNCGHSTVTGLDIPKAYGIQWLFMVIGQMASQYWYSQELLRSTGFLGSWAGQNVIYNLSQHS